MLPPPDTPTLMIRAMDSRQSNTVAEPPSRSAAVLPLTQLAIVCWNGTAGARHTSHVRHGRGGCPTTTPPYGERDPRGLGIKGVCLADDCLDIYHDVLFETGARLSRRAASGAVPADPVRYAATIVRTVLSDRQRAARTAIGWPAKPTRRDGKSAVVNAHLIASAADEATGQWHVALFRILCAYATRPDRRDAVWPVAGLTMEKNSHHRGACRGIATEVEVRDDIRYVLHAAEQAVGKAWIHQIIWHPLLCGVSSVEISGDLLAADGDLADQVLTGWFRSEYLLRRDRGQAMVDAFKGAARVVSGRELEDPDGDVISLLHDLEATV